MSTVELAAARSDDPCAGLLSCGSGWGFPDAGLPEPPDGARLEFVFHTDRYGAWRDIASSLESGWPASSSWCLYGHTVPHSWYCMQRTYGPAIREAVHLVPATEENHGS